jgi:hypothetical protein
MGLVFAGLVLVGVVLIVRSLRMWGCVSFVVWVLVGMAMTGVVLLFASGGLRM